MQKVHLHRAKAERVDGLEITSTRGLKWPEPQCESVSCAARTVPCHVASHPSPEQVTAPALKQPPRWWSMERLLSRHAGVCLIQSGLIHSVHHLGSQGKKKARPHDRNGGFIFVANKVASDNPESLTFAWIWIFVGFLPRTSCFLWRSALTVLQFLQFWEQRFQDHGLHFWYLRCTESAERTLFQKQKDSYTEGAESSTPASISGL